MLTSKSFLCKSMLALIFFLLTPNNLALEVLEIRRPCWPWTSYLPAPPSVVLGLKAYHAQHWPLVLNSRFEIVVKYLKS